MLALENEHFGTNAVVFLLLLLALIPVALTLGLWVCTPVELYKFFATMGSMSLV